MKNSIGLLLSLAAASAGMRAARAQDAPAGENAQVMSLPAPPNGGMRNVLFTENWKFFKGDDGRAREAAFDDAAWRRVDLPHDWSIEESFDPKLASCTAFLPCGVGWYRKSFSVPAEMRDKTISIRFDGVMNHSTVYCNGKEVGGRPYGYSSFTCDLTPAIKAGADNVIAVRVDHEQYADSRWYAGSGIYRNVWLNVLDSVHVDNNGTFVTTPEVSANQATVTIKTTLAGSGVFPRGQENNVQPDATVLTHILDKDGKEVGNVSSAFPLRVMPGESPICEQHLTLANPALWSVDRPVLYRAVTEIRQNGKLLDTYSTPFGIRTFKFDPDKGFSINGVGMKIKGVCVHHDAGALGAAVPIQVWERRLKILQEGGCNAIRCSHNPPAPEFLDLCDRMGFLVMDEAFDEWTGGKHKWITGHNVGQPGTDGYHSDFEKWADIDIRDMVLRDRNHPSIVMWSIGNEIDYNNDPFPPNSSLLAPVAERLIKDIKAVDTTRPVTAACAFPATNQFKTLLDIEGYNYMERLYAGDHAAAPARVMYGSENSHALASWQAVAQNDFIAGQFLWTGIDYLGEAGTWPAHASGAGLLDLAGFAKPQYYFRKSLWSDAPMVYLSTMGLGGAGGRGRGGRGGAGAGAMISCFTNCDTVELFQDGQSLGSRPHASSEIMSWPVASTGGVLKAVGKRGPATTTFELKRAGAAAKLAVKSDVSGLHADGRDVAQIEVDVVDKDGTMVPDAANLVTCSVSGPGRIIGIENGDIRSTENYKALSHSAYQGRMLVYVQALKESGEFKLSVAAPNVEGAGVSLPVR